MDDMINSPLFGMSRKPSEREQEVLENFVQEMPVAVFQALNTMMNVHGFLLHISSALEEEEA